MSFLDKVKNMFIEEVEEDEPIKKEVIQVKIPTPVEEKETTVKEEVKPAPVVEKKEEVKKHVPTFFDDSDFEDLVEEPKKVEPVKTIPKENLYTKKVETNIKQTPNVYNGRRDNTKRSFTPTPIISPVYGVLDKNYKKDEITSKNINKSTTPIIHSESNNANIDDIRNKAFGTLEDEIDINLINNSEELLLDNNENVEDNNKEEEIKEQSPIDIFAELESTEKEEKKDTKKDNLDALDRLLNSYDFSNTTKPNDDEEKKDEIDQNKDLNDSELFNLIDAMYEKKDGE